MVTAIFQHGHFLKEERAVQQLEWKRVLAAFGWAALSSVTQGNLCCGRAPALEGWKEHAHLTTCWGLHWVEVSPQCQKKSAPNAKLLLAASVRIANSKTKSLCAPSTSTHRFSYFFLFRHGDLLPVGGIPRASSTEPFFLPCAVVSLATQLENRPLARVAMVSLI